MVPESNDNPNPAPPLSERLHKYVLELQQLVQQGVEHPRFEFKRSASITREDLDDRLDFIKFIQGVANSELAEERFIVVGADPKAKQFHPVTNASEFDPARVSTVLAKYLEPPPNIEVFNGLQTDEGYALVLLIFSANQPRPIMVKTEGSRPGGKARLQVGEVWIKKGTALQLVSRSDLDLMYRQRIEEEAEDRARKRFKHFSEISALPQSVVSFPTRMPVRELLVGPTAEFRRFAEELIAGNDKARFLMLIELVREYLVEGWNKHEISSSGFPQDVPKYAAELDDFLRDEFLPAIQSVVSLCILIIKYDFQTDWLESAVRVLSDALEESRNLQRIKYATLAQMTKSLQWWRPFFESYVALKTVAVYAIMRDRSTFLTPILQRLVVPLTIDNRPYNRKPVLFWPFLAQMFVGDEFRQGMSTFFWNERIFAFWGEYFLTFDKFRAAACQLELILEFNSHLGVNATKDDQLGRWLQTNAQDIDLTYFPDLFVHSLELTVPMAERLYDVVISHDSSSSSFEVLPKLFTAALKHKTRDQRIVFFGEFLESLKTWQSREMMRSMRFPFMFAWQGRLADAVEKYRAQRPKQ
jgi:hypothetical protein